jgi:hypothetical protein
LLRSLRKHALDRQRVLEYHASMLMPKVEGLENSTYAPAIVAHRDDELPKWASPWLKKQREPEPTRVTVLTATPAGDEFELLFLVDPVGVRALFKSGGFEASE